MTKISIMQPRHFRLRLTPGLPGDSGLKLYAVPERGGLQRTDRAVTTYRLPLQPVGHATYKGNLQPRHHVYAINYYLNLGTKHGRLRYSK